MKNNVIKKDNTIEEFDERKLRDGIEQPFKRSKTEHTDRLIGRIVHEVIRLVEYNYQDVPVPTEEIGKYVETIFKASLYPEVAEEYIKYREEIKEKEVTKNADKILKSRYYLNDENIDKLFRRVVNHVTKDKKKRKQYFKMLRSFDFLPNSPTLMNAGTDLGMLSACFCLPIHDSIEGIMEALKQSALIQKSGGGVGINFSPLRPEGDIVKSTQGTSSGPVSFMELFDKLIDVIKQGGKRRGAMMGQLRVDHPDILEFINAKKDGTKLQNFNLSVQITEEFINKLENKDEDAVKIWENIIDCAWETGDPALFMIDRTNRLNPLRDSEEIISTNPCLTGDTLIQTVEGEIPLKDLVGVEIDVYCMNNDGNLSIRKASNIRKTGENKPVAEIITSRSKLICTFNHPIYTRNKGWVETGLLMKEDKIVGLNRHMMNERHCGVGLTGGKFIKEHRFVAGHYDYIEGKDVHHIDNNPLNNKRSNLTVLTHKEHSFISNQGHVDWNEKNEKGQYIKVKQKKKKKSYTTGRKTGVNLRVLDVKYKGLEDVYNMEVDEYNNYIANGILVHNCGEVPLPAYGSCNLASINLENFVEPIEGEIFGQFDCKRFEETIKHAVDFLNDVIDTNKFPLPEIEDYAKESRRIGLGVMGFANMLIKLGIPYDSDEAVEFADKLAYMLYFKALDVSNDRNGALISIAPTGTISIIANTSSSIEPLFSLAYERRAADDIGRLLVIEPILKWYLKQTNRYNDAMIETILDNGGNINGLDNFTEEEQELFKTSHEIDYMQHLNIMEAFAKHCDSGVSKTINLTNDATKEEVDNIYMYALHSPYLKGITVFRDGCKSEQVLVTKHRKQMDSNGSSVDLILQDLKEKECPKGSCDI